MQRDSSMSDVLRRGRHILAISVVASCAVVVATAGADGNSQLVKDWDNDGFAAPADCRPLDPAVFPGAPDKPDLAFEDTNCDGIDGNLDGAIFVNGASGWTTRARARGTSRRRRSATRSSAAMARARKDVYVAAGTYPESLALEPNVGIYGGYTPTFSARSLAEPTTITGGPQAALADTDDVGVVLQLLTFQGANAAPGGSSYGLRIINNAKVALQRVTAIGGTAGAGAVGGAGTTGTTGGNGSTGNNSACGDVPGRGHGWRQRRRIQRRQPAVPAARSARRRRQRRERHRPGRRAPRHRRRRQLGRRRRDRAATAAPASPAAPARPARAPAPRRSAPSSPARAAGPDRRQHRQRPATSGSGGGGGGGGGARLERHLQRRGRQRRLRRRRWRRRHARRRRRERRRLLRRLHLQRLARLARLDAARRRGRRRRQRRRGRLRRDRRPRPRRRHRRGRLRHPGRVLDRRQRRPRRHRRRRRPRRRRLRRRRRPERGRVPQRRGLVLLAGQPRPPRWSAPRAPAAASAPPRSARSRPTARPSRVLLSTTAGAALSDFDGDGVVDTADNCPTVPAAGGPNGCPVRPAVLIDTDGDTVPKAATTARPCRPSRRMPTRTAARTSS